MRKTKSRRAAWRISLAVAAVVAVAVGTLFACRVSVPRDTDIRTLKPELREMPSLARLRAQQAALRRQLAQYAPAESYIVVDTARNRLYVKQGETMLLDAMASTGSGVILDNPGKPGTQWIFDTPRGAFTVQSKIANPVWIKPDWAFLEEGQDIPTTTAERAEAGVLGEYALGFGNGYFVHGTLYTRMLGRNVTHGCIRLNDDDLRVLHQLADIGTPIVIF